MPSADASIIHAATNPGAPGSSQTSGMDFHPVSGRLALMSNRDKAELDVADGMWHVYQCLAPLLPEARMALDRAAIFINTRTSVDTETNTP